MTTTATPWLAVVGIGEDGLAGLAPAARALVEDAELLVGGDRHLAMVPAIVTGGDQRRLAWPKPLSDAFEKIASHRGRPVCVLASGDPLCFGVGTTLLRRFAIEEMVLLPAPSAFSLAAARMGWSLPDCDCLTLHGRPLEGLQPAIQPGRRLLVLAADGDTPDKVAAALTARGFGPSRLTALGRMGGRLETQVSATAETWTSAALPDLNVIAVDCRAGPEARILARGAGLPDAAFRHDGQLTKREVRAVVLSRLAPIAGQRLWDVGAGCGSVAVEWLRAEADTRAIAIEREAARRALIAENATALGTPDLEILAGEAPAALEGLAAPDAIFVGGGTSHPGLLAACWAALPPGGRLVANAVTLEGEAALSRARADWGGDLLRLSVARADPLGRLTGWRPLMPVTLFAVTKP